MILLRCSEMFHVTYMLRDVTYMLRTCYVRLKSSILRGFVRLFGTRVVRVLRTRLLERSYAAVDAAGEMTHFTPRPRQVPVSPFYR